MNKLSTGVGGEYAVCINSTTKEISNAGAQSCLPSSLRFKDEVYDLDVGLNELMKLKPVSFTLKNATIGNPHLGFIAEDVDLIDKRLVDYEEDGITPRSIRYLELTALLTKAIQEQQAQIEELKGQLASIDIGSLTAEENADNGIFEQILSWLEDKILSVKKLFIQDELCIGDTCVSETQLKELLEKNEIAPASSDASQGGPAVTAEESAAPTLEPEPEISSPPVEPSAEEPLVAESTEEPTAEPPAEPPATE